ncbi:MAG: ornithine--oxo-acid transaminase [Alphaproteobacteria bacterium]
MQTAHSDSRTARLIGREDAVAAANYAPLPVVLERGAGEWLWDVDGKRYLDMMSAYSAVSHGHRHPRLVRVLKEQADRLAITSRAFHTDTLGPFLEKLCAVTGQERALPMNTGAEAVETAIKAARRWGHRVKGIPNNTAEIVVARNNFHGRTTTISSFSSDPESKDGFGPFTPGFAEAEFGDIGSVRAAITERTCAVLMEPIQGEAGIIVPPDGFLRDLRALCDEHGILLILDEIQSGLGRTGRMFAHEHEGIRPDGLILGKALGGGLLPVSAFLTSEEVMSVLTPGSHGSTYGGNPLAAAVGRAALAVLEEEGLAERSARLGAVLKREIAAINHPLIREVRGKGLWLGVEIDAGRCPARVLCERLMERGVLAKETHETVLRFAPPLMIGEDALIWGIEQFRAVVREADSGAAAGPAPRDG